MSSQSQSHDVRELFNLLESTDASVSSDITKLVQENLASTKEAWMLNSLVDYFFITHSQRAENILVEVREPNDKYLVEKLTEGLKNVETRLDSMRMIFTIACRQPMWTHKLVSTQLFSQILKTLKSEIDIPVVSTGVAAITVLMLGVRSLIAPHLQDIFQVFCRLVAFNERKPGNTPDIFLLHLQAALYSLFHRLYGMFPYSFLTFLRHFYSKKENAAVFEEFVKPMIESVRLHPNLVTNTREQESAQRRWRNMESDDILIDCAKISLDPYEGMWKEPHNIYVVQKSRAACLELTPHSVVTSHKESLAHTSETLQLDATDNNLVPRGEIWSPSPSMMIGLSTPPPSQQTTPLSGHFDGFGSQHFAAGGSGTFTFTPGISPSMTPRDTPTDEIEKMNSSKPSSRTSTTSKPNLPHQDSSSSLKLLVNLPVQTEKKSSSVPPSPLRAEFTSDPPFGLFKPTRQSTIRELKFDVAPQGSDGQPLYFVADKEIRNGTSSATDGVQSPPPETPCDGSAADRDLVDSFSMEALPRVMDDIASNRPAGNDENLDEEVSDIIKEDTKQKAELARLTAQSVAQFMKKVNRIRFNSLTNASNIEKGLGAMRVKKLSRSCPQLVILESDNESGDVEVSRSASVTLQNTDQLLVDRKENQTQSKRKMMSSVCEEDERDDFPSHVTTTVTTTTTTEINLSQSVTSVNEFAVTPSASLSTALEEYWNLLKFVQVPCSPSICTKCKRLSSGQKTKNFGYATDLSPPELLERHLTLGGQVHAKELSKIPITSQDSVSWTHFGAKKKSSANVDTEKDFGMPPADEINILRGQIFMLQNQLMYERSKRELHAKRNRRLLRKIARANAVDIEKDSMVDKLDIQEKEIDRLKCSNKTLQEEKRHLQDSLENKRRETQVNTRLQIEEIADLKSAKSELNNLLVCQREEQEELQKRLQDADANLFASRQEITHLKEQNELTQKLKDQVCHLRKELLLMGELQQLSQEKLNAKKWLEKEEKEEQLKFTQSREIRELKKELKIATSCLEACNMKLKDFDEQIKTKEKTIAEMKNTLENLASRHAQELKAVDDKYVASTYINQGLECQILALLSKNEELNQEVRKKALKNPHSARALEGSPLREATTTESQGSVVTVRKNPLTKMESVPAYCEMASQESSQAGKGEMPRRSMDFSVSSLHSELDYESGATDQGK